MNLTHRGEYTWELESNGTVIYRILTRQREYRDDTYLLARTFRVRHPFAVIPASGLMTSVQEDSKYGFTTSLTDMTNWLRGVGVPEDDIHAILCDLEDKGWDLGSGS